MRRRVAGRDASLLLAVLAAGLGAGCWHPFWDTGPAEGPCPCPPDECGDGISGGCECAGALVIYEECDDGNRTNGDGCDEYCHIEHPDAASEHQVDVPTDRAVDGDAGDDTDAAAESRDTGGDASTEAGDTVDDGAAAPEAP